MEECGHGKEVVAVLVPEGLVILQLIIRQAQA